MFETIVYGIGAVYILRLILKLPARIKLSRAKHPSPQGHSKISRYMVRQIPFFEYRGESFFKSDDAPENIVSQRKTGFDSIKEAFEKYSPRGNTLGSQLKEYIPDLEFISAYRVPFPFRNKILSDLNFSPFKTVSSGVRIIDIDGNESIDLTGSYGVNVYGYNFYKSCIRDGMKSVEDLGPVLGSYHPLIVDVVEKLRKISGLDQVSFHMSGTEAVMQAVRLARYHTGKSHVVRFSGAYHGWWDGVQPGVGNTRSVNDVYTLRDMHERTLDVLRTRKDIACVLVNPLQALHPNSPAPGDATLINSNRKAGVDPEAYSSWLKQLQRVCNQRGIVLIMDEIFVGFRLAYGGAQEYFGVQADLVTYGKTLGGGLPVGVICGRRKYMKRYKEERPSDICFARGTFNSHPYVLGSMNAFLNKITDPKYQLDFEELDSLWNRRTDSFNAELRKREIPMQAVNLSSIWTITYTQPGMYNWMFQFYLKAHGLNLSWIGSGRFIFCHNFGQKDFEEVMEKMIAAAEAMKADGWWWRNPELTNSSIQKQFLFNALKQRFTKRSRSLSRLPERPALEQQMETIAD